MKKVVFFLLLSSLFISYSCVENHKSYEYALANEILGEDFISPEDVMNSREGIITYTAPGSVSKTWNEQKQLISDTETVPNATEFIWAITTYKVVRDVYLFGEIYVRTSILNSDGNHVFVGSFDGEGLLVYGGWDSDRDSHLGLSVARK